MLWARLTEALELRLDYSSSSSSSLTQPIQNTEIENITENSDGSARIRFSRPPRISFDDSHLSLSGLNPKEPLEQRRFSCSIRDPPRPSQVKTNI